MATRDYIPSTDSELVAFATNFLATIGGSEAAFGLAGADTTALTALSGAFTDAYETLSSTKTLQKTQTATKKMARKTLESKLRSLAKQVQAFPTISDAQRASLQITVPDLIPTAIPAPTTAPVITIDFSQRGQHTVNFTDSATPNSKAKPAGVFGLALYRKVSDTQPAGIGSMEYVGTYTANGGVLVYEESQFGSQVFYVGFWETAKGLRGPQSDFTNATISK